MDHSGDIGNRRAEIVNDNEGGDLLAGADEDPRVGELSAEVHTLRGQLEEAEQRASAFATELAVREETIRWMVSSKTYRLARFICRCLDRIPLAGRLLRASAGRFRAKVPPQSMAEPSPVTTAAILPAARTFDVICLPIIDWEFRFQRPQHLMRQFALAGHRVFYARTTFHQDGPEVSCRTIAPRTFNIGLPGPFGLNLYRDTISPAILDQFMGAIEALRRREGIHDAVCVIDLPFWAPLAEAMRDRWGFSMIYDCMDEHAGFSTNTASMVAEEERLLRTSDLVLTTARVLTEKAKRHNDNVLPLPNAGDFEHFRWDGNAAPVVSGRPVIGYYGAISDWFDVEMITLAATQRPDWLFRLIGRTDGCTITTLQRLPNVEFVDEIPYPELPKHLHDFDIACIPFRDNELTRATNPVKFFEYLAAGKPVVTVELPELLPYREHYYGVSSAEEFVPAVERALAENSLERVQSRIAFGARHTWEARHETLSATVTAAFGRVAIIVVSYQNIDYLRLCIESIFAKTIYPMFEVIVVDNASEPEVVEYLERAARDEPRLRLILNDDNLGFAKANNQGIELADSADYIVLLNNDTIVTPGWLFGLTRYLKNPQIGMVGPVTSFAGNEARITVGYDDPAGIDAFAREYTTAHDRLHFDIAVLAMFCVAMRRSLTDQIGLLDERFGRGMFEDDDFALRVREAGLRTVCAEDVFVHHWGEGSFGKLERPEYQAIFTVNKQKFEEKWGCEWVAHRARDWDQDSPPAGIVKPYSVDGWLWTCNLCGHAHQSSHSTPTGPACVDCGASMQTRAAALAVARHLLGRCLRVADFPAALRAELPAQLQVGAARRSAEEGETRHHFAIALAEQPSQETDLAAVARSLEPAGLMILAIGDRDEAAERARLAEMTAAGFVQVAVERSGFLGFGIRWDASSGALITARTPQVASTDVATISSPSTNSA